MKNLDALSLQSYLAEYEKPIMDKLQCKITWGIISDVASEAANHLITSSDSHFLGNVLTESQAGNDVNYRANDVLNNQIYPLERIATLEKDFWQLNGSCKLAELSNGNITNNQENGWVSNSICDKNKLFTDGSEPKLVIKFDQNNTVVNLTGLNIIFFAYRNEFPEKYDVEITRKNDNDTLSTYYIIDAAATSYSTELKFNDDTITDNGGKKVLENFSNGITNIKQIVLKIKQWSKPFHRARIDEIEFGLNKLYDNETLVDVEETRVMNTVSSEIPISTFAFTVLDKEQIFDSENPNSLTQYLTLRQPVKIEWVQKTQDKDVKISGGQYYLKEWNDADSRREYKLVAEDLIGFTEEPYYKGIFTGQKQSVKALIQELFLELFPASSGLSSKLDVTDVDSEIKISAPLPLKLNNNQCTYKDCFMMLAQIAGCIITTDDDGKIVFKKLKYNYYDGATSANLADQYKITVNHVFDNPPQSTVHYSQINRQ